MPAIPAAVAATIAQCGFEASGDTWTGVTLSGTGGSFSTNTGGGDNPNNQRISAGSRSFQTKNGTATVNFNAINTAAFSNIQLTLRITSTSTNPPNGSDLSDFVRVFIAVNGAAFSATADISLTGNNNSRWGYNATRTGSTTAGTPISLWAPQGGNSTNNYSTLTILMPAGTTSVDLRLIAADNSGKEIWNIDNVILSGTLLVPVPEAPAWALLASGALLLSAWKLRRKIRRNFV